MTTPPLEASRTEPAQRALGGALVALSAHQEGGPLVALVRSWEALRFEVDQLTRPHRRWGSATDYDEPIASLVREQVMPLLLTARALADDLPVSDPLTTRFLHASMAMLRYCNDPHAAYVLSATSAAALRANGDFEGLAASTVLVEEVHAHLPYISHGHIDRSALIDAYQSAVDYVVAAPNGVLKGRLRAEIADLIPHVFDEPVWFGRGVGPLRRCITAVERCFPGEWLGIRHYQLLEVAAPRGPSTGR